MKKQNGLTTEQKADKMTAKMKKSLAINRAVGTLVNEKKTKLSSKMHYKKSAN